ncbi:MAG: OmpA family protein [Bacteroidetes bacterium]|nr:OmpA family protein [Bacteroidota bacterium]
MKKSYSLSFLVLFISILFYSCGNRGMNNADNARRSHYYYQEIEIRKKLYSKEKDRTKKADIAYKIGEAYDSSRNYVLAEGWYRKSIAAGYADGKVHYQLGNVLKMNENYEKASEEFEAYKLSNPGDDRIAKQIELCKSAIDWKNNPKTRFVVENFKQANTVANDYSPMLYKKEALYLTSDREGTTGDKSNMYTRSGAHFSDIFIMDRKFNKLKQEKWGDPKIVDGDINTGMNEGTPSFDIKGVDMYYTQCNGAKGDSIKNCRVLVARKTPKGWGDGQILPFCDTVWNYGQPTISPDGQKMVFSSNYPVGNKGGHDLWLSTYVKRSKTWSDPINLGDVVNTTGDETFPYFFNDTTLYFSSDGHIGMGGWDIFMTHGTNPTWASPENLKYPINSGADDCGLIYEDGDVREAGFLASNREKGHGFDIYRFNMTPLVFTLSGYLRDSKDGSIIVNGKITLVGSDGSKESIKTDDNGKYFFKLEKGVDYEVKGGKKYYFNSKPEYKTTKGLEFSTDLTQDLTLSKQDIIISVNNIYYDLDKATLRPESKKGLDSLATIMTEIPYIVVELGSHTDCRATFTYNDSLSLARSKSAIDYLVKEKSIDTARLVAKGYGERELVNRCACEPNDVGPGKDCTEEEHQANRRTTVKVLRQDFRSSKEPEKDEPKEEKKDKKKGKK